MERANNMFARETLKQYALSRKVVWKKILWYKSSTEQARNT